MGVWKNTETIPPVAGRQRAHRSAVSNGTRLFCVDGLDGRSQTARRFRILSKPSAMTLAASITFQKAKSSLSGVRPRSR